MEVDLEVGFVEVCLAGGRGAEMESSFVGSAGSETDELDGEVDGEIDGEIEVEFDVGDDVEDEGGEREMT